MPGSLVCLTCKAPLPTHSLRGETSTERMLLPVGGLLGATSLNDLPAPRRAPIVDQLTDTMRRRTIAWLVCDPFDPVPLGAVPTVTIGRSREHGLVLPHTGVSRHHATIRALGRSMLIEDLSTFGTFVNGQRVVSSRELQPGDRIAIGPYELRLVAVATDGGHSDAEGTRQLSALVDPEATSMAGSLARVSAIEVLQGFEFHSKSGTFHVVTSQGVEGAVTIFEGRPMHARFGELVGDEAVLAMALLDSGQFRVLTTAEVGVPTIRASLTELLLEANRRLDEKTRV